MLVSTIKKQPVWLLYPVQPVYTFLLILLFLLSLQYNVLHVLHGPWSGPDLHFTAGSVLYNCVCDEYKS